MVGVVGAMMMMMGILTVLPPTYALALRRRWYRRRWRRHRLLALDLTAHTAIATVEVATVEAREGEGARLQWGQQG